MNTNIIQVATSLLELHKKGYYTVFFDFSGHVDCFYVNIYKGQWKSKKTAICDKRFSLRREQPNWGKLLDYIEKLKEYKPKEKPITIKQHLPFFRPFEEKERITFTYKGRKYTSMGRFKTDDFVTNSKRLDDAFLEENTPRGYKYEDFYKTAKEQGVVLQTDIFQYQNRLVVPCTKCIKTFSMIVDREHV
jgi:hypothetical protein